MRQHYEEVLRVAVNAARIGIWEWDLATGRMTYSPIAREIAGFAADGEITIDMVRAITHPEDYPNTSALAQRALDPDLQENAIYRYRLIRADNQEIIWVLAYGEAQFAEVDGKTVAVTYMGTIQDITEQHRAEEALAASEARLRLAIDAADMAVWELDLQTGQVTGSPELNRLCGFPADATPTREEFQARYAPGEQERMEREGEALAARGETRIQTEYRQIWPDGSEHWMLLRAQIAPGSTGPGQRVVGVLMDITDRKNFEERLNTLVHEMRHRVKNTLAIAQSLASQSLRAPKSLEEGRNEYVARLRALGSATDLVLAKPEERAPIGEILNRVLAPYRGDGQDPFIISGDEVEVSGQTASQLALGVHELATNAAKYGALSCPDGRISVTTKRTTDGVRISWVESGGPPVAAPVATGFGTRLLTRGLLRPPERVEVTYDPTGVACEFFITIRQ